MYLFRLLFVFFALVPITIGDVYPELPSSGVLHQYPDVGPAINISAGPPNHSGGEKANISTKHSTPLSGTITSPNSDSSSEHGTLSSAPTFMHPNYHILTSPPLSASLDSKPAPAPLITITNNILPGSTPITSPLLNTSTSTPPTSVCTSLPPHCCQVGGQEATIFHLRVLLVTMAALAVIVTVGRVIWRRRTKNKPFPLDQLVAAVVNGGLDWVGKLPGIRPPIQSLPTTTPPTSQVSE